MTSQVTNTNAIQVKNFTLKVLGEAFFINSGGFFKFFGTCYRT